MKKKINNVVHSLEAKGPEDMMGGFTPKYSKMGPNDNQVAIGRFTYGSPSILIFGEYCTGAKLKIGAFCSIGANVTIFLGGNHHAEWVTTYPLNVSFNEFNKIRHLTSRGGVIIGNDVWIGRGATILSGITIGDGAVIGAESVVTKSVEPYSVVVGNPAREVKKRFNEEVICKLIEIKWWEWDIKKIKENVPLLLSKDINKFIEQSQK